MKLHMNKLLKIFPISAIFLAMLWGCEIDEGVDGSISAKSALSTKNGVEQGVAGLFGLYHQSTCEMLFKDKLTAYTGADDITTIDGGNKEVYRQADQFVPTGGNTHMSSIWKNSYKAIAACNDLITDINPDLDIETYNYGVANARFIRGILYLDLNLMFGKLPLNIEQGINHELKLSSERDILEQVISDLEFAAEWAVNPTRDEADGVNGSLIDGHASKTAAKAYLAKAYMAYAGWPTKAQTDNRGNNCWEMVEKYSGDIINAGVYSLLDDYAQNFGYIGTTSELNVAPQAWEGNKEAIWSYICQTSANNNERKVQGRYNGASWTSEWSDYFVEWHFYDKVRDDYRKQFSMTDDATWSYLSFKAYNHALILKHPVITKFQWGAIATTSFTKYLSLPRGVLAPEGLFGGYEGSYDHSNDIVTMRYAEVVLMYAEACARNGKTGEATEKLNWVRRRAYAGGLPAVKDTISKALPSEYWKSGATSVDYPMAGESDLVNAIVDERAMEFIGEIGGVRWFDLTRLEIVAQEMSTRDVPGLSDPDKVEIELRGNPADTKNWRFPIPSTEYSYNPNLIPE